MNNHIVALPDRTDMLVRLRKINDDPDLNQFYDILLDSASEDINALGVATIMILAVSDSSLLPSVAINLPRQVPRFIFALIDDKNVAQEARERWVKLWGCGK